MHKLILTVWRTIRADRLAMTGLAILCAIILISTLAPVIATHEPNRVNQRVEGVAVPFDGAWQPVEVIADQPLNAATLSSPGQGFAVGSGGRIAALQDGMWEDLEHIVADDLHGIDGAPGLTVAVGDAGTVLHHTGDDGWLPLDSGTDATLFDVAVASPEHALAVGEAGTVRRWDGARWADLRSGTEAELLGVRLRPDGTGAVVGAQGTVLAYDGERLESIDGAGFRDLHGLDLDGDELIAVGERGTIMRYRDEGWQRMHSPESRTLADVRYLADSALAVGDRGVALLLRDGAWERSATGYGRGLRGLGEAGGHIVAVGTDPYVDELASPSARHLFGTTHLGRDIFSQTIWGSRTALLVGFMAAFMVTVIGTNVGLIAGYFKGRTGSLLMRVVDVMYALPFEPFALVLVLIFRPSLTIVILAIGLLTWRTTARIIRSQVLSLSERPFVKAARVAGASDWRILYVHIGPNVLPLAFLQLAVAMAFAITAEATLSFLGLGPPQVYSWGGILHEARLSGAWRTAWWWIIPPGLFIMATVVAVFFIARALEVLTNPRLAIRR